jgi:hypothetical protein
MPLGEPENGRLADHPHHISLQNVNDNIHSDHAVCATCLLETLYRLEQVLWRIAARTPRQPLVAMSVVC